MAYRTPKDLADRMAARRRQAKADDGYARETFTQPREQARRTARAFLNRWPAAAYMTAVESWRELPGGEIEFTMKRLQRGLTPCLRKARSPVKTAVSRNGRNEPSARTRNTISRSGDASCAIRNCCTPVED
jgi:hypothetical protein